MDNAIHRISKYSCIKMGNWQTTLNFKLKPPTQYKNNDDSFVKCTNLMSPYKYL